MYMYIYIYMSHPSLAFALNHGRGQVPGNSSRSPQRTWWCCAVCCCPVPKAEP